MNQSDQCEYIKVEAVTSTLERDTEKDAERAALSDLYNSKLDEKFIRRGTIASRRMN